MDPDVKKAFEEFCSDVGMNASTAVNMFAKAVLREHRLPFEVVSYNLDPFYSAENQARLLRAKREYEAHGGKVHQLIEPEDD